MIKFILSSTLLGLCLTSAAATGTKQKVDTNKSVVEWKGAKITGDEHVGTIKLKSGEFSVSEKEAKGEFIFDMTSIVDTDLKDKTYRDKLEGHLKSEDFFNVAAFPTAKFILTEAKRIKGDTYEFKGNLTVKATNTHEIAFTGDLVPTPTGSHLTAVAKFDRTMFDVRYNSGKFFDPKKLGDKLIHDEVVLKLNLVSELAPEKS